MGMFMYYSLSTKISEDKNQLKSTLLRKVYSNNSLTISEKRIVGSFVESMEQLYHLLDPNKNQKSAKFLRDTYENAIKKIDNINNMTDRNSLLQENSTLWEQTNSDIDNNLTAFQEKVQSKEHIIKSMFDAFITLSAMVLPYLIIAFLVFPNIPFLIGLGCVFISPITITFLVLASEKFQHEYRLANKEQVADITFFFNCINPQECIQADAEFVNKEVRITEVDKKFLEIV
jgi:hypothetical protein